MAQPTHVTFIHGLANKPPKKELRRKWLEALKVRFNGDPGFDLEEVGVSTSFVYWADLFYTKPIPTSQYENLNRELEGEFPEGVSLDSDDWIKKMRLKFPDEESLAFEEGPIKLDGQMDTRIPSEDIEYERIPIPWFLKRRIMKALLKEAHDYLFNVRGIRDVIRERVIEDLKSVPENTRHVFVGHSQGSIIAYDVLKNVTQCKPIDGFLTLGSPLGIDEIQDKLDWSRKDGFPEKLTGDWVNVYDPYDVVSRLDPKLANDFQKNGGMVVIDIKEENWGRWRHSATKYFKGPLLRKHLRRLCYREGEA